ncbi:MAG: tetratricopeptide repeat protein [Gammaproteobacteria bacterium]|nr:tetratricopeptide repeat protein [Gammaproteobacteria bacterium]
MIPILFVAVSCDRHDLPAVPTFDQLGFADAHETVRNQVLATYEKWQEEPRDADRNGRLAMVLSVYGKNVAAEVLLWRARSLAPNNFRWTYYLAITLGELGRPTEAAEMFRNALEIDPGYIAARIKLAKLQVQTNQVNEGVETFRGIADEFPTRVEGWLGLGKALDLMGDRESAINALQRARIIGPQYGEVHYALATALAAAGDEEGAAREFAAYERTAKNKIRTEDPLLREVQTLNASDGPQMANADYHLRRNQLDEAAASFRSALAINPLNQDAWGGLIHTQVRQGKIDEAGDTYREALAAGISYARVHLTYGKALLDQQQHEAAREIIGKAVELDPRYADALKAMGNLELQRGASEMAVKYFRQLLSVQPNDRDADLSLSKALNAASQFQEAATRLETLTNDPAIDSSVALKELAIAFHGLNRRDDAIDSLLRGRDAADKSANQSMLDTIDALLVKWQKDAP